MTISLSVELPQTTMKMLKFLYIRIILISICCVLFWQCDSCSSDDDRPTDTTVVVVPKLNKVNFFLDASASTEGFLRGAKFQTIINDFITKAESQTKIEVFLTSDSTRRYNGSLNNFTRRLIDSVRIANGRSSELYKIFDEIGKKTGKNDISVLVSDCILSLPDNVLRKDTSANQLAKNALLKANIFRVFSAFHKKKYGAILMAYTSSFNGRYFDYRNYNTTLTNEMHPFYIWLIGDKEILKKMYSNLKTSLTEKPEKILEFGIYDTDTTYQLLGSINQLGKWSPKENGELAIKDENKIQFTIGVNLSSLPDFIQDNALLKKSLKINNELLSNIVIEKVENLSNVPQPQEYDQVAFNKCTHFITLSADKLTSNVTIINLTLPLEQPKWYEEWSSEDDKTAEGRIRKTFAFKYLINGVSEAYKQNLLDLKIKLIKN